MESNYVELPFEILVYIFKYLSKSDRKAASETCYAWYLAANDKCFLDNKVVILYKTVLTEEDTSPLQIFINSQIDYCNYLFNEVEVSNKISTVWDKISENVKSLILRNCDICEKVFIYMLQSCPNLKCLGIQSCRELFMSGRLLEGKTDGLTANSLKNLSTLSLAGNQYLTDALFNRFIIAAPELQVLDLSGCSLQFHLGLIKRFYPPNVDIYKYPSESVLTFYFVLQFIMSKAVHMKRLLFSNTLIDGAALKSLSEVKDLQLEVLEAYSCDQLTNVGITALTMHQTSLKELNLVNLEYLNIQRCRAVTDLGISDLNKLPKLKSLNISQCEQITKTGLENGICAGINRVLNVLDIHSLNLDQSGLILVSEKLPELHTLDISYCFNAVTDASIQEVIKNQTHLQVLRMSHCDKVSDAGLTGMGIIEIEAESLSNDTSYNDNISQQRIHLGSRAEEEIVRDAQRKRDVMKMCERLTTNTNTGYSLARLTHLQELDISGCNRITDVSLIYAFKLQQLVILNMSRCQQVTHEGIDHLVKNCPSIEHFNLIDCYNLKDDAVSKIVIYLRRLKHLELKGCNQLTDKTLEAVQEFCEKLQVLDVQGCRSISPELACSISNIPTLHTILISKPGPYIAEGLKSRKTSHFLPSLMRKLLSRHHPPQ